MHKKVLREVLKNLFCNISIDMTSTRSVVIIRPSNAERQRILPNYVSLMKMENITPGVTRIFSYELRNIDGHTAVI